jgi:signal transduction histidine kinase
MDQTMISRVFDNLLRNAVEAMPEGGILRVLMNVDNNILNITVEDTGLGISPENIQNIFQPFYTTKSSGTGLGLYYSKLAIQSHGGKIVFRSEKEKGTSFHIRLPVTD